MELELRSVDVQGAHEAGGALGEGARPPPSWTGCGPPGLDSFTDIFYIFQKVHPWIFRTFRELSFLHKNNTMAILLKTASVRVSPFKSCKLEPKIRAKEFGKVDTMETYHHLNDT